MVAGGETQTTVSVILDSGSRNAVGLSATGVPSGASVSFTPVSGTASFVSVLVIDTTVSVTPGTYQITIEGRSGTQAHSSSFELVVSPAPPASYALTVSFSPQQGGTTDPAPGTYIYQTGQLLTVTALPSTGWSMGHWLVNGNSAGNATSLSFVMTRNTVVQAVFSEALQPAAGTPKQTATASVFSNVEGPQQVMVDGTAYSLPVSFNWAAGSTHVLKAENTVTNGSQTALFFSGWTGSLTSTSQSLSVTAV